MSVIFFAHGIYDGIFVLVNNRFIGIKTNILQVVEDPKLEVK